MEKKYPNFRGLNLTWESLEGIVKHNGVIKEKKHSQKIQVIMLKILEKVLLIS